MQTNFIVYVGMPEVILSYPWVPHPDTNHLLHGEGRRDTDTTECTVAKKGKYLLSDRGSAVTNTARVRIGKSHQISFIAQDKKRSYFVYSCARIESF